jgi:mono/diheme cytochrome c family protein
MRRLLPLALALVFAALVVGCGGEEVVAPTPETVVGTLEEPAAPEVDVSEGDPEAGLEVFNATGCGACHTLEEAGSNGTIGPNLDDSLADNDAEYVLESIVSPDTVIAEGFDAGVMPGFYGEQLDEEQLANLVALLAPQS